MTVGILADVQKLLESQKLTNGARHDGACISRNNPATNGQPDFAGMMAAYTQFFGTKDQPNKPARTTGAGDPCRPRTHVSLIEIDLTAARPTNS